MIRALIVDDQPEARDLLRATLSGHGYEVVEARHGAEAIVLARQAPPDLVISDLLMPVMDGYALLRDWEADARLKSIPFIVHTTTYTDPQDEQLALDLGAAAFIRKPCEPDALLACLQEVLAKAQRGELPEPRTGGPEEPVVLREYCESMVRRLEARMQQLQQGHHLSSAIIASLPGIFYCIDRTGRFLRWNANFERVSGYSTEEFARLHPLNFFVGPEKELIRERIEQVFARGAAEAEAHLVAKDGTSTLHFFTGLRAMIEGQPQLVGMGVDISGRKQAEQTLRDLSVAVGTSGDIVFMTDKHGCFLSVNSQFTALYGFSAAEVVGRATPRVLKSGQHPQEFYAEAWRTLLAGEVVRGELVNRTQDGRLIEVDETITPFRDEQGNLAGFLAIQRDITARKQSEQRQATLYAVTRVLAESTAMTGTLQRVLQIIGQTLGWEVGEFWTVDEAAHVLRCHEIWVSPDGASSDFASASRDCTFTCGVGLPGRIWQSGRPTWIPDVATDDNFLRPELARQAGLQSAIGFPVQVRGRTVAVLDFLGCQPRPMDEELVHVFAVLQEHLGRFLEQERQEAALRLSELRFRTLFDNAPVGVAVIDPATTQIEEANEVAARQLGYSLEEFLNLKIADFEAAESPEDTRRHLEELQHTGRAEFTTRHRSKLGDLREVWVTTKLIELSGRQLCHSIFLDITERKRAAEELAASEKRFRALIENASDLISVVNQEGVIRFQGPSSRRLLGYPPEAMMGRSTTEWVHPEDQPRVVAALQRALTQPDEPIAVEYRFRHQDGDWRTLESMGRSVPHLAADGFVIVNSRDVTLHRRLEERLRQSQKMEAIGQLAGGVAHDFNNILTAIILQVQLTSTSDPLPEEAMAGLEEIQAAANRAAALTRQLLMFSRRQVMQLRDLDLNDVVTGLAKMLQRIIGEDIHLQLHLHPTPLLTHADPGMLDQVLLNLAVNARDAMPAGGRLRIETARHDAEEIPAGSLPETPQGRCVRLKVSDTGTGIPPEALPHIFEPFFTTKEPGKGTGLGLATVFGIVKQHRGWIEVLSEPGKGTEFQVYLPALDGAANSAVVEARPQPRGGTETILLAEDDDAVRSLTKATLERHGYRVLSVASGVEAIQVWPEHRDQVALLLTDLVMPGGVDGQQLARQLQEDNPNLKVVFTSGYSAEIAGRKLELRRGECFVQKPCPPDVLLEALRRCLDGARR